MARTLEYYQREAWEIKSQLGALALNQASVLVIRKKKSSTLDLPIEERNRRDFYRYNPDLLIFISSKERSSWVSLT
jgi:hypothetical protein